MGFTLLQLLLSCYIFLSLVVNGNAGVTSTFIRSEWPSVDIPLDNEVFAVPKGYNAPQQVSLHIFKHHKSLYHSRSYEDTM